MAQDHIRVARNAAVFDWARRHWLRLSLAVAALVLLIACIGLWRVQQQITAVDARLGADIIVAASGIAIQERDILLMDLPQGRAIDPEIFVAIKRTPGVAVAVPLYNLGKLSAQECPACVFGFSPQFVGIDPQVAFNIWPWWKGGAPLPLTDDTLIAGWDMPTFLLNADWSTYGHAFTVAGILQPTGTLLDNTMLMTVDAAQRLAKARAAGQAKNAEQQTENTSLARTLAPRWVGNPGDGVSTVLIRTSDGIEPHDLATRLARSEWDLDITVAPAYVTTLRHQLRQTRRVMGVMGGTALIFGVSMGIAVVIPHRRRTQPAERVSVAVSSPGAGEKHDITR